MSLSAEQVEEILNKKIEQLEKENRELKKRDLKLEALEQAGVDNWDGYGDAMDLLAEWNGEEED